MRRDLKVSIFHEISECATPCATDMGKKSAQSYVRHDMHILLYSMHYRCEKKWLACSVVVNHFINHFFSLQLNIQNVIKSLSQKT